MGLSEALLPEFDHEMSGTRKTLERVPDEKMDWTPHPRSSRMGALAAHVANIVGFVPAVIANERLDLGGAKLPQPRTGRELVELFQKNRAEARAAIERAEEASWMKPFTLLNGGHQIFSLPRVAAIRGFILSHLIHHRAQLALYLRLNDVPVPALYGPSADEAP